jgi:HSP20 family protein
MAHPLDDLMDAWMDMITARPPRFRATKFPTYLQDEIGDWEDKNGEITVTVDMPGVAKKDIEMHVDKHIVKVEASTEDRDYSFSKKFTPELNPDKVEAKFNNGVLDIKIQKAEESKGKKISIK